jgi:hypothetical protein
MKTDDRTPPYAAPEPSDAIRTGASGNLADVVTELLAEVRAREAVASNSARSRTPVTRFLLALTMLGVLAAVCTSLYGIYRFPDAPVRQTAAGYVGKTGRVHTPDDFATYGRWTTAMVLTYTLTFGVGLAFAALDRRRRTGVS